LRDPIVSHAWSCDTESLCRLVNVDNVLLATNPTTAMALMEAFKITFAAKRRLPESFYRKLESPSVRAQYGIMVMPYD
jgi:methylglyoxal synthase|tara:strand:- start:809 stop:1042 length:234 start_codon:yes stop_codon:yes gene_type:complete